MTNLLPETNLLVFCLWLLGKRKRLRVVGNSMLPLLSPGEEILIDPNAYNKSKPEINHVVAISHPIKSHLTIVKRIKTISEDEGYFLMGDNPAESTDSRHWGTVSPQKIIGRVTNRFSSQK